MPESSIVLDFPFAATVAVLSAGSEKAAAHRLGLSPATVKHHLASARSKVGAETTAQLVRILGPAAAGSRGLVAQADEWRVPDGPEPGRRPGCLDRCHGRRR